MMAIYRKMLDEITRKPGDVWKTGEDSYRGMNQSGNRQTFKDKEKTDAYVTTKDVKGEEKPKSDTPSTAPSEKEMKRLKTRYDGNKRQKIQDQIGRITDTRVKESAQIVSDSMDSYLSAGDDEKEKILRNLVDNKLISVNTTNPDAGTKKVYFDSVLSGLDRKALGDGDKFSEDMHRIMQERGIDPPQRLASADRALADMSGKHNESGMVFLLTPKGSPSYEENRKIHENNEKSYSSLGGNAGESTKRNESMVAEINKTFSEGTSVTDAKNTGGIGGEQLAELYNINEKVDPTDLIVFFSPPKPDPSVEVPSAKELEKKLGKKFKDMNADDLAERNVLIEKRYGGMRKISAKAYTDPSHITMKNSGARKAGSEYLGKPEFDKTLLDITTNPKYNYQEEGISDDEKSARKLAMKREYMKNMAKEMDEMVKPGSDGEKQLVKMWQDVHGCGHGTWTSVSNKKTGESKLYSPDHYCNPKTPFKLQKNGTSVTLQLDDSGDDAVEIVLKTESKSTPKLLFNHKKKKIKKEQYESLEGTISRMKL
jgi:hypothetical protein